jgi:hypothetical protein
MDKEKIDYFTLADIVSGYHPSSKYYQESFTNREVIRIYNDLLSLHTTEKLLLIDELISRLKTVQNRSDVADGKFSKGYLDAVDDLQDCAKNLKQQISNNFDAPNISYFGYLNYVSNRKMFHRFSELFIKKVSEDV